MKLLRKPISALIMVGALTLAPTLGAAEGPVIGDADGDGRFGASDVAYLENVLEAEIEMTPQKGLASDVAFPCDGVIDEADFRVLQRALRLPPRSTQRLVSDCHDAEVGQEFAGFSGVNHLNIDEHFALIADQIPQFGGFFFDPDGGHPTVVLTEENEGLLRLAKTALKERFGGDRFGEQDFRSQAGDYGFGTLADWRLDMRSTIFTLDGVVALDIDETTNRLVVGLSSWIYREEVENVIVGRLGIPLEAVTLKVTGIVESRGPNSGFQRPLRAGKEIGFTGSSGSHCTMGPIVNRGGVRGFLTNSHCTAVMGDASNASPMHQPFDHLPGDNDDQTPAGVILIDRLHHPDIVACANVQGPLCRYSDSAFFAIGKRASSKKGMIQAAFAQDTPTGERFATSQGDPFYGEDVRKSGRSTGVTGGSVAASCIDVLGEPGHLNCQYAAWMDSAPGDSGSPVYRPVGSYNAHWVGIMWGEFGLWSYFSPISGIEKDLGAFDGVAGNGDPRITITTPVEGDSIGGGSLIPVQFQAEVFDPDNGKCSQCGMCQSCEVTWTASVDGFLGITPVIDGMATIDVILSGAQTITATVEDPQGATGDDSVTVTTNNLSPSVSIQGSGAFTVYRDATKLFVASSYDPELWGPMPCSSLSWSVPGLNILSAPGCSIPLAFPNLGSYAILLHGQDSEGNTASDWAYVNVVEGPTTGPPQIEIISPTANSYVKPNELVFLRGIGNDPDDDPTLDYRWVLFGSGLANGQSELEITTTTANDNEAKTSFWFPPQDDVNFQCGGRTVNLRFEVRDQSNSMTAKYIPITVLYPPC